jgi:hypothetical protein
MITPHTKPVIGTVLFPGFELLDTFGPLEFFLITPEIGPDGLYAPERASDAEIWETLGVRSAVRFDVDFGRRGPIARDVHPVR